MIRPSLLTSLLFLLGVASAFITTPKNMRMISGLNSFKAYAPVSFYQADFIIFK
jgi:hypothetical protein